MSRRVRIVRDFGRRFLKLTGLGLGVEVEVDPYPPPRPDQVWVRCLPVWIERDGEPMVHNDGYCLLEPEEYEET